MKRFLIRGAGPAASVLLALAMPAQADGGALIWEFSRSSETSYAARLGSRLPTGRPSSAGAELRLGGPDPSNFGNPVALWANAELVDRSTLRGSRTVGLSARIGDADGKRRISVSHTLTRHLRLVDAELRRDYVLHYARKGDRRVHARATRSLRLTAPATGTVLQLRSSLADDEEWRSSIGFEQPLFRSISLTATVDEPTRWSRRGRIGASYRHGW